MGLNSIIRLATAAVLLTGITWLVTDGVSASTLAGTTTTGTDSFAGNYVRVAFPNPVNVSAVNLTFARPAMGGTTIYCQVPVDGAYPASYDRSVQNASAWMNRWTISGAESTGTFRLAVRCGPTQAVLVATGNVPAPAVTVEGEDAAGSTPGATATMTSARTVAPTPTRTVGPTVTVPGMPTATATGGHDHGCDASDPAAQWHPPTDHEHGDAPPAWIAAAGYHVCFVGAFSTSAAENTAKHAFMKGFLFPNASGTGQDVYLRIHAGSSPADRSARYHSYEVFFRDAAGAVSHVVGWYDSGDTSAYTGPGSAGRRISRQQFGDPNLRPAILVVDQASWDAGIRCEQWYTAGNPDNLPGNQNGNIWRPDFGYTICNSTTIYTPGENANPNIYDPSTWVKSPGGELGTTRRLEFSWYGDTAGRSTKRGTFWADQFGNYLTGPTDPRVGTVVTKYGANYTVVALQQTIQPSLQPITFADGTPNQGKNAVQKSFPCSASCKLPN